MIEEHDADAAARHHGSLFKEPGLDDRLDQITEKLCRGGLLIVTAKYDVSGPETMTPYFTKPKCRVKWTHFPLSSHFTMLEETEDLIKSVGTFLTMVE